MMHPFAMEWLNLTKDPEFFLMGFSNHQNLRHLFFVAFLLLYLLAMLGNNLIVITITLDISLHTPMYFFLANLATLDISFTSIIIPKLLEILLSETKSISYYACMTQMFLFSWVLGTELLLLAVMGFDRYVAICKPLHYTSIINRNVYISLAVAVWVYGMVNSMAHTGLIMTLSFQQRTVLDHFFCEIPAVIKVSISDSHISRLLALVTDIYLAMACSLLIFVSYIFIVSSIVRIRSAEKKMKAFSTCASHLLVVTLFYGATIYTYVLPALGFASNNDKVFSFLYAVVSPTLNPMIYSLRSKEVKQAFFKIISKTISQLSVLHA